MAAIWQEIEIEYQGETYKVTPTIEFINYLEQGDGRSLSQMLIRASNRDLPSGLACEIIAKTINFAGGKTTVADVFSETGGGLTAFPSAVAILQGCLPAPVEQSKKKPTSRPSQAK